MAKKLDLKKKAQRRASKIRGFLKVENQFRTGSLAGAGRIVFKDCLPFNKMRGKIHKEPKGIQVLWGQGGVVLNASSKSNMENGWGIIKR